ncbi:MAG: protein YgfX [Gammaproteobacteria bacterium]
MSKLIEPPFMVTLKPSRRLRQVLIAVHCLAVAAAIANTLPIVDKLSLLVAVSVHYLYFGRGLNTPAVSLRYTDVSGWEVGEDSYFEPVAVLKSTVLTTFAIWLQLKPGRCAGGLFARNRKTVLIMSDALDQSDYCRLIVKLKTAT